jgi:hypothetical protein
VVSSGGQTDVARVVAVRSCKAVASQDRSKEYAFFWNLHEETIIEGKENFICDAVQ